MTKFIYSSAPTLAELRVVLQRFIPAWMEVTPKESVDREIRRKYNPCYDLQLKIQSCIKDIEMSQYLGGNDVILPIIINEYRLLKKSLDDLRKMLGTIKYNETKTLVDNMLADTKVDVGALLMEDLNVMRDGFLPDLDIRDAMTKYKT